MSKTKIKIETTPSGYALTVDKKEYLYFKIEELMAGILVHVGLEHQDYMTNENIYNLLLNTILGTEYAQRIENMRGDIEVLERSLHEKLNRVNATISTLKDAESKVRKYINVVDILERDLSEVREKFSDASSKADTLTRAAERIEKKIEDVKIEMQAARQLLKDIGKASDEGKTTKKRTPQSRAAAYGKRRKTTGSTIISGKDGEPLAIIEHTKSKRGRPKKEKEVNP